MKKQEKCIGKCESSRMTANDHIREYVEMGRRFEDIDERVPMSNSIAMQNSPYYAMSSDGIHALVSPASEAVTYETYMYALITQILNTSCLCGQPILIGVNKKTGFSALTYVITISSINAMVKDEFFETVGYCDGVSSTILKNNGEVLHEVICKQY